MCELTISQAPNRLRVCNNGGGAGCGIGSGGGGGGCCIDNI